MTYWGDKLAGQRAGVTGQPPAMPEPRLFDAAKYGLQAVEAHMERYHELGVKMVSQMITPKGSEGVLSPIMGPKAVGGVEGVVRGEADFAAPDGSLIRVMYSPEEGYEFYKYEGGFPGRVSSSLQDLRSAFGRDTRPQNILRELQKPGAELISFHVEPAYDGKDQCLAYGWKKHTGVHPYVGPHVVIHYGPEGTRWKEDIVPNTDPGARTTHKAVYDPNCVSYVLVNKEVTRLTVDPITRDLKPGEVVGKTDVTLDASIPRTCGR